MSERTTGEPEWIAESTLMIVHAQQIERYGGAHGIIDRNVVPSTLARPIQRWTYDESADLSDFAAAYLVGFARAQAFRDGNKRTALACSLVFLSLNGGSLHVPPAELYALTMSVANGTADDAKVAAHIRERLV